MRHESESAPPAASAPNLPAEARVEDPAFTAYLNAILAEVARTSPEAWVGELRAETLAHLEALAAAYEELGEPREAAVAHACRQLGEPRLLRREWSGFNKRSRPERFRRTVSLALQSFVPAALVAPCLLTLSRWYALHQLAPGLDDYLVVFTVLGLPVVSGAILGLRSRGRRFLGTLAVTTATAALTALFGAFVPGKDPWQMRPFLWEMDLVYWLPLGSLAAVIVGKGFERIRARRRRIAS